MNKILIGGVAALLMVTGSIFIWNGMGETPDPAAAALPPPEAGIPVGAEGLVGAPPPDVPTASPATREQRRFARYDRNRDGQVTRLEMLSTRTAAFRRLDRDRNNLLSFEEWAVATSDRFAGADADRSGSLTPSEFATTAPQRRASTARCRCPESDGDRE